MVHSGEASDAPLLHRPARLEGAVRCGQGEQPAHDAGAILVNDDGIAAAVEGEPLRVGQSREHVIRRRRAWVDRPESTVAERGDPHAVHQGDGHIVRRGEHALVTDCRRRLSPDLTRIVRPREITTRVPRCSAGTRMRPCASAAASTGRPSPPRDHAGVASSGANAQDRAARRVGDQQVAAAGVAADAVDTLLPRHAP